MKYIQTQESIGNRSIPSVLQYRTYMIGTVILTPDDLNFLPVGELQRVAETLEALKIGSERTNSGLIVTRL